VLPAFGVEVCDNILKITHIRMSVHPLKVRAIESGEFETGSRIVATLQLSKTFLCFFKWNAGMDHWLIAVLFHLPGALA
jgi:hypothetical protein